MEKIQALHEQYKGILGYRRMTLFINRSLHTQYNPKRILRLMRLMGIQAVIRKTRYYCTRTSEQYIEENKLNRQFTAEAPNQKWCTDVTFLQYGDGLKAYLSVIKDLYDGSIVAYQVSKHNDNPLVMSTLKQAIQSNPDAKPMLHSDRGAQYTSREYRLYTTKQGITRSMSRVGKCIDNSPVESFFGHFKEESYYLTHYPTYEALVAGIDSYIEFYNHHRYQTGKNNLTPIEFRYQIAS